MERSQMVWGLEHSRALVRAAFVASDSELSPSPGSLVMRKFICLGNQDVPASLWRL